MTIKTKLKEIADKGIGLIADEFIRKNQVIYRDDINFDRIFSGVELERMPLVSKDFITTYAGYSRKDDIYYLCCDNARFWNHSDSPNTKYYSKRKVVLALKDIYAGEELTADYREFCDYCVEGDWGFEIH